jgi:hypothetical protein
MSPIDLVRARVRIHLIDLMKTHLDKQLSLLFRSADEAGVYDRALPIKDGHR